MQISNNIFKRHVILLLLCNYSACLRLLPEIIINQISIINYSIDGLKYWKQICDLPRLTFARFVSWQKPPQINNRALNKYHVDKVRRDIRNPKIQAACSFFAISSHAVKMRLNLMSPHVELQTSCITIISSSSADYSHASIQLIPR